VGDPILHTCPYSLLMWRGVLSGVQKERMEPGDMYVLSGDGDKLIEPSPKPYPYKSPKCTDCGPLFMKVIDLSSFFSTDVNFYWEIISVIAASNF
jgi:hypothetical protein